MIFKDFMIYNKMQYLGRSAIAPVGSIMSYIGTTDPEGWVICDGTLRTCTDSRYTSLATILGGTNTGNSLRPPDLRSKFLYSTSDVATTLMSGGSTTVTLTTANLPSHSHTITISDPGHTHNNTINQNAHSHGISIYDPGHAHGNYLNDPRHDHYCLMKYTDDKNWTCDYQQNPPGDSGNNAGSYWYTDSAGTGMWITNVGSYTGIWASSDSQQPGVNITNAAASTGITATASNVGTGSGISILPPYSTVNYIMKY